MQGTRLEEHAMGIWLKKIASILLGSVASVATQSNRWDSSLLSSGNVQKPYVNFLRIYHNQISWPQVPDTPNVH